MGDQTGNIHDVLSIGVPVTDQDRALEFYVETLGLEKRRDGPAPQLGGRWIAVAPPGGAVTIALVPERDKAPAAGASVPSLPAVRSTDHRRPARRCPSSADPGAPSPAL